MINMIAMAPTPRLMLPVTLEIRPTSVVPMNEAPFPQMSYRPKYSPDIADGISRA